MSWQEKKKKEKKTQTTVHSSSAAHYRRLPIRSPTLSLDVPICTEAFTQIPRTATHTHFQYLPIAPHLPRPFPFDLAQISPAQIYPQPDRQSLEATLRGLPRQPSHMVKHVHSSLFNRPFVVSTHPDSKNAQSVGHSFLRFYMKSCTRPCGCYVT